MTTPVSPTTARTARGLVLACHPLPSVFVTTLVTAYGLAVGLPAGRAVLLAAALLAGQLSVGWCNDAVDAGRDTAAARPDKPVPAGLVTRRAVAVAAGSAAAACAVLSLALGLRPGALHLAVVASAWLYDVWLKSTPASGLPYLFSFGLVPSVATLALSPPRWAPVGVMAATALLGFAAHFANTVGDAEADAGTGVRGLPQRVGPRGSLVVTAAGVAAAGAVLAGTSRPEPLPLAVLVAGCGVAAAAAVSGPRAGGRTAFRLTLLAVALVVTGFLLVA